MLKRVLRSAVVATSAVGVVGAAAVLPLPDRAQPRMVSAGCAQVQLGADTKPLSAGVSTLNPAQVLTVGQALSEAAVVSPTLVPTPGLINLANFIDNAYNAIEPWVAYAFELVSYAVSWIPYIGWIIDDQIWVVYNFVESLINSGVFNVTDWMRGEGTFAKNLADWVVDLGLALVWLGIDEIGAWIPLPPLNYPPRPPYADLPEGLFGDVIVDASAALARISNRIWDVWEPIKGGIDNGVNWLSEVLARFERVPFVPLINFELNATWDLIATEGDALVGFAHDLINAGNQFVIDTIDGGGLIAATVNAFNATLASIRLRGGAAVQGFVDWGRAQIDYLVDLLTPGSAGLEVSSSVARVKVVEESASPADAGDSEDVEDGNAEESLTNSDRKMQRQVAEQGDDSVLSESDRTHEDESLEESVDLGVDEGALDEDSDEPGSELGAEPDSEAEADVEKPDAEQPDADAPSTSDTEKSDAPSKDAGDNESPKTP